MKIWLTRQANGLYMLTHFKPTVETVFGSNKKDVYIIPGEPIGVRNLCDKILVVIENAQDIGKLKPLESIQIELTGSVITD